MCPAFGQEAGHAPFFVGIPIPRACSMNVRREERVGQCRQNSLPSGSCMTAQRWPGWLRSSTNVAPASVH